MAGAARGGAHPLYAVTATFLQRAYDQLMEDWAMNPGASTMLVAETGVRGIPDQTHLGFWDIPMIASIPGVVYLAPASAEEYKAMLEWSARQSEYKVAIRVPDYSYEPSIGPIDREYSGEPRFAVVRQGSRVAIIAAGDFLRRGLEVADLLRDKGVEATVINPRYVSGVDADMLAGLADSHELAVTLEDGSVDGGFGQRVAAALGMTGMRVMTKGLAKRFADRYDPDKLEESYGLTAPQIAADIMAALK